MEQCGETAMNSLPWLSEWHKMSTTVVHMKIFQCINLFVLCACLRVYTFSTFECDKYTTNYIHLSKKKHTHTPVKCTVLSQKRRKNKNNSKVSQQFLWPMQWALEAFCLCIECMNSFFIPSIKITVRWCAHT